MLCFLYCKKFNVNIYVPPDTKYCYNNLICNYTQYKYTIKNLRSRIKSEANAEKMTIYLFDPLGVKFTAKWS